MNTAVLHAIDAGLLALFRYRTRRFLRMEDVAGAEPPEAPKEAGSLYLHVPFCPVLCPFCSFHRVQHHPEMARPYFHCLREEMRRYHEAGFRFNSAYFGGGTPTSEPEELIKTIELAKQLFGVAEISVETNPKDLRPEILRGLREAGVTRLSVGVQSFDDRLLKEMGRFDTYGSGEEARDHLRSAAGMFPTLNVDLIFNQPHQDIDSLRRDLAVLRSTGANQVSFYPLMSSRAAAERMRVTTGVPSQRRLREFYELILSELMPEFRATSAWCFTRGGQGSDEYIVNADFYIGIGSGAFSYLNGALYVTTFSLQNYQHRIMEGLTGITAQSCLSRIDQMRYDLLVKMFGLRLEREWTVRRHGARFFRRVWGELRTLEWLGAANRVPEGWELTERGMYWLVLMMSAFFESVNEYRDAMRAHVESERKEINGRAQRTERCKEGQNH